MDNLTLYITAAGGLIAYWYFNHGPGKAIIEPTPEPSPLIPLPVLDSRVVSGKSRYKDIDRIQEKLIEHVERIDEDHHREVERFHEEKLKEADQKKKSVLRKVLDSLS